MSIIQVKFGCFSQNALKTLHKNAGFFSCCSVLLHLIVKFYNLNRRLPNIVDTSESFNWYKPEGKEHQDIFLDFFSHNRDIRIPFVNPILFEQSYQFRSFHEIHLQTLVPFIQKYFYPSPRIQTIIKKIKIKYQSFLQNIEKNVCVLFFRGNDKKTECLLPMYSLYVEQAKQLLKLNPSLIFLIQSDETEFIETMLQVFPTNSFYFKDETRNINHSNTSVDIIDMAKNTNYYFSQYFLSITIIMSQAKYVVCNLGNCSLWIALFRGHSQNIILV
jgi:hypothetical protein